MIITDSSIGVLVSQAAKESKSWTEFEAKLHKLQRVYDQKECVDCHTSLASLFDAINHDITRAKAAGLSLADFEATFSPAAEQFHKEAERAWALKEQLCKSVGIFLN